MTIPTGAIRQACMDASLVDKLTEELLVTCDGSQRPVAELACLQAYGVIADGLREPDRTLNPIRFRVFIDKLAIAACDSIALVKAMTPEDLLAYVNGMEEAKCDMEVGEQRLVQ